MPALMLPRITAAAGNRLKIIVVSGFRRGSDVLKGPAPGAHRAIAIFDAGIRRTMTNRGVRDIASLGRDHVVVPGQTPPFGGTDGGLSVAAGGMS